MKEDVRGSACYRLHETMREYAGLKLREAGEEEAVEGRCAEYYGSRGRRSAEGSRSGLLEWLEWMDLEIDNVRSVLRRHLVREDFSRGIDLAVSLGWYWITRATTEGVRWLDELLASERGRQEARAWAYFIRGYLAVLQADPTAARPALERSVAAARDTGQVVLLSVSLSVASIAENMASDRVAARRLLNEAQVVTKPLDDFAATVTFLQARALNGLFEGDLDAIRSAASEGARLSREAGALSTLEYMLINLGFAALIAGDPDQSKPPFAEALRIARQIDDRVAQYYLLGGLGCHAARAGQMRLAALLLGAAETQRSGTGARFNAILAQTVAQAEQSTVAALGGSKFEAEFNTGKRLSREAGLGIALGEPAQRAAPASDETGTGLLGKREAEVARLVADGLSNKQIGGRLLISDRTVATDVRSILNKLGFNSRAQIAAWMASNH